MPTITFTLPVAGQDADAGPIATNFTNLQTLLNAGLDASNWATGKIFAPSKLTQEAATTGQTLGWNGSIWAPTDGVITYRKATQKDVVNTVTETDLLNGEISIGAGVLGTTKAVRVWIIGDYLNNSGAGASLTPRVKLGATTIWGSLIGGGGGIAASATRRPFVWEFVIGNQNAANVQECSGFFYIGDPSSGSVAGLGTMATDIASLAGTWGTPFFGTAAEDTTTSKALVASINHGTANANISCRLQYAFATIF